MTREDGPGVTLRRMGRGPKAPLPRIGSRASRGDVSRRFRRHRLGVIAVGVLALAVLAVTILPSVLPYGPTDVDAANKGAAPSVAHLLGTDELGRDLLARILDGGRLTLSVALSAAVFAIGLGTLFGATAGYAGGIVDNVLMRIVDVFYSLPSLFVVILVMALVGANFWSIVLAIGLFSWMNTARIVRSGFLATKEKEFIEAAHGIGAGHFRIALRHILPATFGPIIVTATLNVAFAIITESALSFLGLGFQAPDATWGGLLNEAQRPVVAQGQWWLGLFPGLMIFLVVLAINYIGDAVSDALDPRRRKR